MVQAMKPTTKILSATAPDQLREQARAGVDADDGDEHDQPEVLQDVAGGVRRVAEEAQPRDQRRDDHARHQQPAGIAEADVRAGDRERDRADQEAEDHAERQRQQVGRRARARDAAHQSPRTCPPTILRPATNSTSKRCSLVFEPHRDRLAARARCGAAAIWPANSVLRNSFSSLPIHLLVGDQDLGLVERDVEHLRVRHLRADQAHLLGHAPPAARRARSRRPSATRARPARRGARRRDRH